MFLRDIFIYYWQKDEANLTMFLSIILVHSCTIKHCIVIENIFVCYYFQSFGPVQTLERHVNNYFIIIISNK